MSDLVGEAGLLEAEPDFAYLWHGGDDGLK